MKFQLIMEELTEASYEQFNALWDNILPSELKRLNAYLDKYGFEVELLDEYYDEDSEIYADSVGIFCRDIQDNASVFPIYINKNEIYKILSEDNLEMDASEIKYAIEGTLWHEAGHGIIDYLAYEYDFDDEEETAEDFAQYKENSDLASALQDWVDAN